MKHLRTTLHTRWQTLTARERTLLSVALLLICAFLLWTLAIAPAWRTLQQAEARQQALDRDWQTLRDLQAEAQTLRARAARPAADLLQALNQSLGPLNAGAGNANTSASAQLQRQADQAVLTLRQVPAAALAAWLAQLRAQGLPAPTQAQLQRAPTPAGASGGASPHAPSVSGSDVRWSGTLHFQLPAN